MKLDMCFKNKRTYNSTVRFTKYVVMLICLVRVLALCYNLVCSQILSLNFNPLNNILDPYIKKSSRKILFNYNFKRDVACKTDNKTII